MITEMNAVGQVQVGCKRPTPHAIITKVFWFFFSKKNYLPSESLRLDHGFRRYPVRNIHQSHTRQSSMNAKTKPRLAATPTSPTP